MAAQASAEARRINEAAQPTPELGRGPGCGDRAGRVGGGAVITGMTQVEVLGRSHQFDSVLKPAAAATDRRGGAGIRP